MSNSNYGFMLQSGSDNNTLTNNIGLTNGSLYEGIYVDSSNNNLSWNSFSSVRLDSNTTLVANTITSNTGISGILVQGSNNVIISNNATANLNRGIDLGGIIILLLIMLHMVYTEFLLLF